MRPSRHRRDALCIGDCEVPGRSITNSYRSGYCEHGGEEREASSAPFPCPSSSSSRLLSIGSAATCAGPTRRPDTPISLARSLSRNRLCSLNGTSRSGDVQAGSVGRPPLERRRTDGVLAMVSTSANSCPGGCHLPSRSGHPEDSERSTPSRHQDTSARLPDARHGTHLQLRRSVVQRFSQLGLAQIVASPALWANRRIQTARLRELNQIHLVSAVARSHRHQDRL